MGSIDLAVFRWVNRWPDAWSPLLVGLSEGNKWLGVRVFLLALFAVCLAWRPARRAALTAVVAWPLANGITEALKWGFQAPRPSAPVAALVDQGVTIAEALNRHPEVILRVAPLGSYGTASAHSANMMAVAVCFFVGYRPLGWAWVAVAILTGVSRVYVGVHYPYQVLLGWLCGLLAAFVVIRTLGAWSDIRQRRAAPQEAEAASPDSGTV
ncbi:MAG: phosphatase PAP2 family protein [Fimbriimonadaceae bacterium]|nr:phosphatase PAP2 family protein [Fimbriimonadaceae bacterium]QYK59170.1 MAG: phosphatase PAP2 family protein [Fimbriimonadaceae bacterium]